MDATQSSNLSQWGKLDWDDELEELCMAASQSTANITNDTECKQLPQHEADSSVDQLDSEPATPPDTPAQHWTAPYHPGWTSTLSPSLSPSHSTPPEVNAWAFSALIGESINREIEIRGDEIVRWDKDLRRHTVLCSALLHTDDLDFEGYAYPYGAIGCKRVLQKRFGCGSERRGSLLRGEGETVVYTDADRRAIQANVGEQLVDIWGADSPDYLQNKMEEDTGTKPINSVNEQETDMATENAETSPPHQRKESQPSTLLKAHQDNNNYDEETLSLAQNTALPGIDLIDDFVEDRPLSLGSPLDILHQLAHALESADSHMAARLRQITKTKALNPAAESAQQQRTDMPDPHKAPQNNGTETREPEKEEQAPPPSSLFSTLARVGGFLREFWRGSPKVLD